MGSYADVTPDGFLTVRAENHEPWSYVTGPDVLGQARLTAQTMSAGSRYRWVVHDEAGIPLAMFDAGAEVSLCAWCSLPGGAQLGPLKAALGTGNSYHRLCRARAEAAAAGITASAERGTAEPVGADAEPGDLYGPVQS